MPQRVLVSVAFLTDFGLADGYAGVMKGVVLSLASGVSLIDISHAIPPQQVATGAWVLATCYRYFSPGTIFVCVVDPGVGSLRLPVALHAGEWFFVGPDNGLFSYILQEQPVHAAVALTNTAYHRSVVSSTFQGRDIFSPVAAHIANGVPLAALGSTVQPMDLQRLDIAPPLVQEGQISGQIVHIDHFGNLITNIAVQLLPDLFMYAEVQLRFMHAGAVVSERRRFFSDSSGRAQENPRPFLYVDSSGYLAVALQNSDAASVLRAAVGERVILTHA